MFVQPIGILDKTRFGINLNVEDFKCQTGIDKNPKINKKFNLDKRFK